MAGKIEKTSKNRDGNPGSDRPGERFQSLEENLGLVKYQAQRIAMRMPAGVDREDIRLDLENEGFIGLMDAEKHFNPERGVKFSTYAPRRIRGAMLDSLRNTDWVPRLVRERAAVVRTVRRAIEQKQGSAATDEQIAAGLKKKIGKVEAERTMRDALVATMDDSLSKSRFEGTAVPKVFLAVDERAEIPLRHAEEMEDVRKLIRPLHSKVRSVMELMYLCGLGQEETGRSLGMSASRVSQLHKIGIAFVKESLVNRGEARLELAR